MSEPRRYFLKLSDTFCGVRPDVWEHEEGMFIDYDDYALLKKQLERLTKASNAVLLAHQVYENGIHPSPQWVKQSSLRDAVSKLHAVVKAQDEK